MGSTYCTTVGYYTMLSYILLLAACLRQYQVLTSDQLPRFNAYWESQLSYLYNDDELDNPWHIDLGNIDVGPLGYPGGPNVVTIDSADYCVDGCQEDYPDEFCSKYPPEGVPNKPRMVDDWGTKYNITANMMEQGIKSIHERGGKVILSYGGTLEPLEERTGITAMGGGGYLITETTYYGTELARRIYKNIVDWDLDGVDFFWAGLESNELSNRNGVNPTYHWAVVKELRRLVGPTKTISYTTIFGPEVSMLASCHPFLDYINIYYYSDYYLGDLELYNIPLSKIGILLWERDGEFPDTEAVQEAAKLVKERGLSGLSLFSINQENERYRGQFARMIAETLYD